MLASLANISEPILNLLGHHENDAPNYLSYRFLILLGESVYQIVPSYINQSLSKHLLFIFTNFVLPTCLFQTGTIERFIFLLTSLFLQLRSPFSTMLTFVGTICTCLLVLSLFYSYSQHMWIHNRFSRVSGGGRLAEEQYALQIRVSK